MLEVYKREGGRSQLLTSARTSPRARCGWEATASCDGFADRVVKHRAADGTLTQKPGAVGCISQTGSGGACATGTALDAAASVAVSPDGGNAYVASELSHAVAVFDREPVAPPRSPPPPLPPLPPPPPPPPAVDRTSPLLSALSLRPSRFVAASSGASIRRGGSKVSYELSEPAAVRFTVQRASTGRRSGGRCLRATRSNRRAKRCTRYRTLAGSFTHRGSTAKNAFTFSGRLRNRRLVAGRYRLQAIATDAAANRSRALRSRFQIRRR